MAHRPYLNSRQMVIYGHNIRSRQDLNGHGYLGEVVLLAYPAS